MGLDMYLTARRFNWGEAEAELNQAVREVYQLPEGFPVYDVRIEVGHWRKANQIHMWVVNNVQKENDDCGTYVVTQHDLLTLRNDCVRVLEDNSLAAKLLPTSAGFFFGSTEYEDYYFDTLKDTIEILDKAIALPPQWEIEYRSSW